MSSSDLSPPNRAFRSDCINWLGYKPCDFQALQHLPDCTDCKLFDPTGEIPYLKPAPYDPKILREVGRIGIMEAGGLGSILRTTAVSRAIRILNPAVEIGWFTHSRGANLLQYAPGVEAINMDTKIPSRFEPENLDLLINFESQGKAGPIVSRAKCVAGFAINQSGKFYPTAHAERLQRLQIDDSFRSENKQSMQAILLESIGLSSIDPQYDLRLTDFNHSSAKSILDSYLRQPISGSYIGINIGTSPKGEVRRWPVKSFVKLALKLADRFPDRGIAVFSGPDDTATRVKFIEEASSHTPANLSVLPNDLEIGNFMACVGAMDVLVTSNTFAFHAARAQDVPIVTFEGPLPVSELKVGPRDIVLTADSPFKPCFGHCSHTIMGECVKIISVENVLNQVDHSLRRQEVTLNNSRLA